jgi:hypothetical protein
VNSKQPTTEDRSKISPEVENRIGVHIIFMLGLVRTYSSLSVRSFPYDISFINKRFCALWSRNVLVSTINPSTHSNLQYYASELSSRNSPSSNQKDPIKKKKIPKSDLGFPMGMYWALLRIMLFLEGWWWGFILSLLTLHWFLLIFSSVNSFNA